MKNVSAPPRVTLAQYHQIGTSSSELLNEESKQAVEKRLSLELQYGVKEAPMDHQIGDSDSQRYLTGTNNIERMT